MLYTEYDLDDRLQRALATAEFITPTPIQAAALPLAMAGRDLVGTAQTGTGKTAAFVLPILQRIIATPLDMRRTRAVILAPTRELVEQILAVVRELGIHTNVRAVAVYGGVAMQPQTRALRGGVDIVVACPGRLLDHMKRRNPDFRQLDCLVLDEADRMLDMGFMPNIEEIISNLPEKRQTMLFSATFAKKLNVFVKQTLCDPARVEVDTAVAAQTVRHTLYQVKSNMKVPFLTTLLRQLQPESDSVLIFTKTRVSANEVAGHLHAAGMHSDVLHAEKTQFARQETLDRFRAGVFPYLVATDIAARGIDVTSISHVINYDLPSKADDYLHRIGRTGRMERTGHAISLMTRADMRSLHEIERMLGKRIEVGQLEENGVQQMSEAIPVATASPVRPTQQHAPSHHGKALFPRATPRSTMPIERFQRTDRAERPAAVGRDMPVIRAPFPRKPRIVEERPTQAGMEAPEMNVQRAGARRDDVAPPRVERSPRKRYPDALPSQGERSRTKPGSDYSSAPVGMAVPEMKPRRFGARRDDVAPPRADRPQRKRYPDADSAPTDRPATQYTSEKSLPRPRRADRAGRPPRVAVAAPTSSPRREQREEPRFVEESTFGTPRPPRAGGKPFTGVASSAKYNRKHVAGKRQPGAVASGPRGRSTAR